MSIGRRRQVFVILLSLSVLTSLFLLITSVSDLQLLPGKPLRSARDNVTEERGFFQSPEFAALKSALPGLLLVFFALSLTALLVQLVLFRHFRRELFAMACGALLVFLFFHLISLQQPKEELLPDSARDTVRAAAISREDVEMDIPDAIHPPGWGVILLAIGIALGVTALATLLTRKLYPFLRGRRQKRTFYEELAREAGRAAEDIRAGGDPYKIVLRCYKTMSDLLSKRQSIHRSSVLTPREFASRLRELGVEDQHVNRLTTMFELVRYGGRRGSRFVSEALACLEAVKQAYAMPGSA